MSEQLIIGILLIIIGIILTPFSFLFAGIFILFGIIMVILKDEENKIEERKDLKKKKSI